jgi:hypothetical protein
MTRSRFTTFLAGEAGIPLTALAVTATAKAGPVTTISASIACANGPPADKTQAVPLSQRGDATIKDGPALASGRESSSIQTASLRPTSPCLAGASNATSGSRGRVSLPESTE